MQLKGFIVLAFCTACAFCENVPIVTTTLGKISGIYERSYNGREFSAFYGIPFAKPPIGDLRFQEPHPASRWPGTWNANLTEIICAQIMHVPYPEGGIYTGDEDCLYLNIFVPSAKPHLAQKLDVIVHIHGGGLMFGSSNAYAGPGYLMDKDVILVTINYRVGVLGFLSTEDEILPGNNGMKDQVLALKWIKEHISNFGGNPESITLTGLSAGGASVHLHYLSPLSRGLFSRGISFSGNALVPWVLQEEALRRAKTIGAQLGCNHEDTNELVNCLKQRPTRQIVESLRAMRSWLFNPFSPLGVVVEKAGNNKFLDQHPYMLLKTGAFYDVPWITSLTSEEGLYPGADYALEKEYLPDLEKRWLELAPSVLDYNYTIPTKLKDKISQTIKEEYMKGRKISEETYKLLIDIMSDRLFSIPAENAVRMQALTARSPVYFYYFTYEGDEMESFTIHFTHRDQHDGVSHGDDLMYIFTVPHKPKTTRKLTNPDERMKEIFMDLLISYSSTGKPTIKGVHWDQVTKDASKPLMHLHIRTPTEIQMQDVNEIDRHRSMWESIPFEEHERLLSNEYRKDEL